MTLAETTQRLTTALADLGTLQHKGTQKMEALAVGQPVKHAAWRLALDEQFHNQVELRPRLADTGPSLLAVAALAPAPPRKPIKLDPLTVVDDHDFVKSLKARQNLPNGVAAAIAKFYSG